MYEDQILVFGSTRVDSYFPATGEQRWWLPLSSNGSMGAPVLHADTLIVTASGSDQPWLPSFDAVLAQLDRNRDGLVSLEECKDEKDWFEHFGWVDANHDKQLNAAEWNEALAGVGDYGAVSIPLRRKGRLEAGAIRWRLSAIFRMFPRLCRMTAFYMVKDGGIVTSLDPPLYSQTGPQREGARPILRPSGG